MQTAEVVPPVQSPQFEQEPPRWGKDAAAKGGIALGGVDPSIKKAYEGTVDVHERAAIALGAGLELRNNMMTDRDGRSGRASGHAIVENGAVVSGSIQEGIDGVRYFNGAEDTTTRLDQVDAVSESTIDDDVTIDPDDYDSQMNSIDEEPVITVTQRPEEDIHPVTGHVYDSKSNVPQRDESAFMPEPAAEELPVFGVQTPSSPPVFNEATTAPAQLSGKEIARSDRAKMPAVEDVQKYFNDSFNTLFGSTTTEEERGTVFRLVGEMIHLENTPSDPENYKQYEQRFGALSDMKRRAGEKAVELANQAVHIKKFETMMRDIRTKLDTGVALTDQDRTAVTQFKGLLNGSY